MSKSDLSEDQLSDLRATLEAERDSLDEELAAHGRKVGGNWAGSTGSQGEESDPNDAADNIESLAANVPLVEELEGRRREIDKALEKMDKGTYGVCDVCKKPIDFDRLEANPAAATCVEHAQ
ncbi:TraR/DksA C4-type zinc finger protein [Candidatus Kaiserbacteria bacterium]|nr:TraR/DksA C4-type zinc finger protein [Candidatus Kaiserbacteria bacterium]